MEDILSTAQELVLSGWRFWAEDGRLRFRAPKTAIDDEVLSRLREHKVRILSILEENPESLEICPLSYGQRAMWFLWKLAPESHAYNLSLPVRLPAGTSPEPWRTACEQLVARHPQLRSTFSWRLSEPVQQVHPPGSVDWQEVAAEGWDEEWLANRMTAEHRRPFDFERGPMLRCRWFAHDDGVTLLLTCHHIVNDAWSQGIMLRELELLAAGEDAGPSPAATYHDFVHEERARIEGDKGKQLWEYWSQQLAPPLPILELPQDWPRPPTPSFRGGSVSTSLPPELTQRLQQLATEAGSPLSSAILAALGMLLMRISGQRDLLIGMPLLGRQRAEHTSIVGYFVDPVVVRLRLTTSQTFLEFLAYVHKTVIEAVDHGSFPFALLVERLAPKRDPSRSPLFDVLFNHLKHAGHRFDSLDMVSLPQVEGQFDITLTVTEASERLELVLRYSEDLFRHNTTNEMMADLIGLLEQACKHPELPVLDPATDPPPDALDDEPDPDTPADQPATDDAKVAAATQDSALNPVERQLAAIWREMLDIKDLGPNDDFFRLGGHSLLAVQLSVRIEEVFGVSLPVAQVLKTRTLAGLARSVETTRVMPSDTPDILVPMRETGTLPPAIAIPGSGGNILYLEGLVRRLPPERPIWGLQALGIEDETAPIPGRVEEIAARYLELLDSERLLTEPVALFGHSFGGLLVFEIARQLQARGAPPPVLVGILDIVAPDGLPTENIRTWDDRVWLEHIGVRMEKLFNIDLGLDTEAFEHASLEARLESMVKRLTATGLMPVDIKPRHLARFAEIYRVNSLSATRYSPDVLEAPTKVTLFKAKVDDPDLRDQLRGPAQIDERTLGWDRYTALPIEVIDVEGTHLSMLTEPAVEDMAAQLAKALAAG